MFTVSEFLFLLRDCFGELLTTISDESLRAQLLSGECYADREYFAQDGSFLGSIRVFRLGLVCVSPLPRKGVRLEHSFCFPFSSSSYRLHSSNFVRPFPVHDPFSQLCFAALTAGVSEEILTPTPVVRRKIPLWDGSGSHVADHCFRYSFNGRSDFLWFEIHTGSEGYDERYLIPRLLSAEFFCKGKGRYVVIVPFKRDLSKVRFALEKYNRAASLSADKPFLELTVCDVVSYTGLDGFREKLGLYRHRSKV
ncbi:MAG: hypothetical protein ACTSO7_13045 [Candidatus Heimdallarchaeota archaeon]